MKRVFLALLLLASTSWGGMDFNAADSRALNTTASGFDNNRISFLVWFYPTAYAFGTLFQLDENHNAVWIHMDQGNQAVSFRYYTSGTRGQWLAGGSSTPSMPITLDAWYCIAITYDRSNLANDPTMYLRRLGTDGDLVAVTPDQPLGEPTGTYVNPNTGYGVGADNTAFHENPFAGCIYAPQVWNTELSEADFESASLNPGAISTGLILHLDDSGNDLSSSNQDATLTNVGSCSNPPGIPASSGNRAWKMLLLNVGGGG